MSAANKIYNIAKENNWGEPRYVVWADNCSIFDHYRTIKAAEKDCRKYGIKLKRMNF